MCQQLAKGRSLHEAGSLTHDPLVHDRNSYTNNYTAVPDTYKAKARFPLPELTARVDG